jgi:hypothetical protein
MSGKFDIYLIHVLNRVLNTISHEHPAALPVALWIGENKHVFGPVPRSSDRLGVDPVTWRALLKIVGRTLNSSTTKGSTADRLKQAGLGANPHVTAIEAEILVFMAVSANCEGLSNLVALLADKSGLSKKQVQALFLGITETDLDELLTGRLERAGLIKKGEASPALLSFASA